MAVGYLGYAQIADVFLLTNSTGLNRQVNPLMSNAVWGAGWYNAASVTNYADNQQHFEGPIAFELQALPAVWNLIRDWLIEERAFSQSAVISPNGSDVYNYTKDLADPRSGLWAKEASFSISAEALITVSMTSIGLKRVEVSNSQSYATQLRNNVGAPTGPLNPSPRNLNPIPGWYAEAEVTWPNAPDFYDSTTNPTGMVLMSSNVTVSNNTFVVRGCTADVNPVAVIQGTINATGNMTLWRDGGIPDPYAVQGVFTAETSSVVYNIGGGTFAMRMPNVLLTSDAYDVQGQNNPVTRNFGINGLGDGVNPPFLMDEAV